MEVIDNVNHLLGDNLKQTIAAGSKLRIAASCFSIYAFEALKSELEKIESLQFIFTSPTFVPGEVTDRLRKEHREFHIPKLERERSLYGSEFEVRLRNELTQKAIAKECADWMRRKRLSVPTVAGHRCSSSPRQRQRQRVGLSPASRIYRRRSRIREGQRRFQLRKPDRRATAYHDLPVAVRSDLERPGEA